jgi:hypothetical protein
VGGSARAVGRMSRRQGEVVRASRAAAAQYSSTMAGRSVSSRCCPFAAADSPAFTTKASVCRVFGCRRARRWQAVRVRCGGNTGASPARVVGMAQGQGADAGQLQLMNRLCALISHHGETKHPPAAPRYPREDPVSREPLATRLLPSGGLRRPHAVVQERLRFSTCTARRQCRPGNVDCTLAHSPPCIPSLCTAARQSLVPAHSS